MTQPQPVTVGETVVYHPPAGGADVEATVLSVGSYEQPQVDHATDTPVGSVTIQTVTLQLPDQTTVAPLQGNSPGQWEPASAL